jgi:hypothetical protein
MGKNCIPNISAIRVIRGHLNAQIPKAEEPRMTRSGSAATEGFNHGFETHSLPALARRYPRGFSFCLAVPAARLADITDSS